MKRKVSTEAWPKHSDKEMQILNFLREKNFLSDDLFELTEDDKENEYDSVDMKIDDSTVSEFGENYAELRYEGKLITVFLNEEGMEEYVSEKLLGMDEEDLKKMVMSISGSRGVIEDYWNWKLTEHDNGYVTSVSTASKKTAEKARKLTNEELADLSLEWENPTVDTSKYFQDVMEAWEVDRDAYEGHKGEGGLAQEHAGRYYIASKKTAAGTGVGAYRRGVVLTDLYSVRPGQLLVYESILFKATNLIKVTQTFDDKIYAIFVDPENPAEKRQASDEEFVVNPSDLEKGEYYIALEPAPTTAPETETPEGETVPADTVETEEVGEQVAPPPEEVMPEVLTDVLDKDKEVGASKKVQADVPKEDLNAMYDEGLVRIQSGLPEGYSIEIEDNPNTGYPGVVLRLNMDDLEGGDEWAAEEGIFLYQGDDGNASEAITNFRNEGEEALANRLDPDSGDYDSDYADTWWRMEAVHAFEGGMSWGEWLQAVDYHLTGDTSKVMEKLLPEDKGKITKITTKKGISLEASKKFAADLPSDMLQQYLVTALWSTTGDDEQPLDDKYFVEDFAPEALAHAQKDVSTFMEKAKEIIKGIDPEYNLDESNAGHDFWLTRNGHGAGFWDGDYPEEIGEALTTLSKEYGEGNLYEGDDGTLHFMGEGTTASKKVGRKISKKKMDAFTKEFEEFMQAIGAKSSDYYKWVVDTFAGPLYIRPDEGYDHEMLGIFTRFDNPKEATELGLDSNPYSGKWNFYDRDPASLLSMFKSNLSSLLSGGSVKWDEERGEYSTPQSEQSEEGLLASKVTAVMVSGMDIVDSYNKLYDDEISPDSEKGHFADRFQERIDKIMPILESNGDLKQVLSLSSNWVGKVTKALMNSLGISSAKNLTDLKEKLREKLIDGSTSEGSKVTAAEKAVLAKIKTALKDMINKFWVVTKPTPDSTLIDILFESDVLGMMQQAKGGLTADKILGIYKDKAMAQGQAEWFLKNRGEDQEKTAMGEDAPQWNLKVKKDGEWELVNKEPMSQEEIEDLQIKYEKSGITYEELRAEIVSASKTTAMGEEPAAALEVSPTSPQVGEDYQTPFARPGKDTPYATYSGGSKRTKRAAVEIPQELKVGEKVYIWNGEDDYEDANSGAEIVSINDARMALTIINEYGTEEEYNTEEGYTFESYNEEPKESEYELVAVSDQDSDEFLQEPTDEDIVINEDEMTAYYAGRPIAKNIEWDELADEIHAWMEKEQYWPSIYVQGERGNITPHMLQKKGALDSFDTNPERPDQGDSSVVGSQTTFAADLINYIDGAEKKASPRGDFGDDGSAYDLLEKGHNFTGVDETEVTAVVDEYVTGKALGTADFDGFIGFIGDAYGVSKESSAAFKDPWYNDDVIGMVSAVKKYATRNDFED